jgi:hypothetical protein
MGGTTYAKTNIRVNGGPAQSGGVEVAPGDTVQLVGESTVGWKSARWSIIGYPPAWTPPPGAGWNQDPNSGYFFWLSGNVAGTNPPPIPMPTAAPGIWGKWLFELIVVTQQNVILAPDSSAGVEIIGPNGERDFANGELKQFHPLFGWTTALQTNVRLQAQTGAQVGAGTPQPTPSTTVTRDASGSSAFVNVMVQGQLATGSTTYAPASPQTLNLTTVRHVVNLQSGVTAFAQPTNMTTNTRVIVRVVQPPGGNATATWDPSFVFNPSSDATLSTAGGAVDIFEFECDGEALHCMIAKKSI